MMSTAPADPLVDAISRSGLIPAGSRVLVAVSGGPDSTALLVAARESGLEVVAAHFDHGLKAGSDLVAADVRSLCRHLGVDVVMERRAEPMPHGSVQAAARELRYSFLDRAMRDSGSGVVALAHTADDLVEGVVLHMLRGCGLAGLRGMPAVRGHYVRPWLHVWRSEVADFLSRRGIVAHADPSNLDRKHARVRVRMDLLPAMERDRPGIRRRLHAVGQQASRWHDRAQEEAFAALAEGPADASRVGSLAEPVAAEILAILYRRAGGAEPGLSRSQVRSMLALASGGRGGRGVDLPGGLRFRIVGGQMQVTRLAAIEPGASAMPRLEVSSCSGCSDENAVHLREGLMLRIGFRTPGLRMRPAGGRGTRKLQDIFVDSHVPREERDAWPLVFAGDRLAWVPGIALDADHDRLPGKAAVHVSMNPMPVRSYFKVARLGTSKIPRGESS